jgi:tRNA A37 threonylcarbamoyladenosine dehydratase
VEALARSGVAQLVLVDFDHVSESNINRQIQALGATVGQSKGEALRDRIADIHPVCEVLIVDDFASPENWPALLPGAVDVVVDACDQVLAKTAMAAWAMRERQALVTVGAAGGKRAPQQVRADDLSLATHDPLLASMRQRLRKAHGAPRTGLMGLRCVYSAESVVKPAAASPAPGGASEVASCEVTSDVPWDRAVGLQCAGYGSSVMVTATFGLVAAAQAVELGMRQTTQAQPMV